MIALVRHAGGVVLPVLAHPGSKRNAVLGERAGALRVAVTAPPEKGKANAAIQAVLAAALRLKPAQLTLLSGAAARPKRFLIAGIGPEELGRRLATLLPPAPAQPDLGEAPDACDHGSRGGPG
ncbi:MAG TPA: DUF167 family protein [Isosphaeraceae bacterium]|nr:DUF167 family protein [Isosphaeraceae bacterium]